MMNTCTDQTRASSTGRNPLPNGSNHVFGRSAAAVDGRGLRQYALDRGTVEVFVERIEPAPRLLVCGAGFDAGPLVRLAAEAGHDVTVVDGRAAYASAAAFPAARPDGPGRA